MKKVLLAILGIAFALSFASCDDQEKKVQKPLEKPLQKPLQKPLKGDQKLAHQHKRW